jgi:hypothetical protein
MDEEIALRHLIDSRFRSALPRFGGLFLATEFSSGLKAAAICCWRERASMIETQAPLA